MVLRVVSSDLYHGVLRGRHQRRAGDVPSLMDLSPDGASMASRRDAEVRASPRPDFRNIFRFSQVFSVVCHKYFLSFLSASLYVSKRGAY